VQHSQHFAAALGGVLQGVPLFGQGKDPATRFGGLLDDPSVPSAKNGVPRHQIIIELPPALVGEQQTNSLGAGLDDRGGIAVSAIGLSVRRQVTAHRDGVNRGAWTCTGPNNDINRRER
jgi:hypothetical protein